MKEDLPKQVEFPYTTPPMSRWERLALKIPLLCQAISAKSLCEEMVRIGLEVLGASKVAVVTFEGDDIEALATCTEGEASTPFAFDAVQTAMLRQAWTQSESYGGSISYRESGSEAPVPTVCVPVMREREVRAIFFAEGASLFEGALALAKVLAGTVEPLWNSVENFEMLEQAVAQEMAAVVEREESISLILDSMNEGLVACDLLGFPTEICSASVSQWFGEFPDDQEIWHLLFPDNPSKRDYLELGFSQMTSGFLPFELAAKQTPKEVHRGERVFSLNFAPVEKEGELVEILLVISDVSAQIEAEHARLAAKELTRVVEHIVRDRTGFLLSVQYINELLDQLGEQSDLFSFKQILHTLKGNSGTMGFEFFARACHELEEKISTSTIDGVDPRNRENISMLNSEWRKALKRIECFLEQGEEKLYILEQEYNDLIAALSEDELSPVLQEVRRWKNPRVKSGFMLAAQRAPGYAASIGKDVELEIEDNDLRVPSENFQPFIQSLVQVVRNAVAHGIEEREERRARDKIEQGKIRLVAVNENDLFVVSVEDDGRGIDWEKVRHKSIELGLPHETLEDLERALFCDGLTTLETAGMIAGRGIGLSAVASSCERLGADISLETKPGEFTRWVFSFPIS